MKAPRYMPCTDGPGIGVHAPNVFLEKTMCKNGAVTVHCMICQTRKFGTGATWKAAGYTRDQVRQMCPGAVDGRGQPI